MRCEICNGFTGSRPLLTEEEVAIQRPRGTRHRAPVVTWEELRASGNHCFTCRILVRGCRGCFQMHGLDEREIESCQLLFYYQNALGKDDDVDKEIRIMLKDRSRFDIQIFITGDGCPVPSSWEPMPIYDRPVAHTGSDAAIAKIQDWIQTCLTEHGVDYYCDSPEEPSLPTRVIDVGLADGTITLKESNSRKAKYITLSHCWGQEPIITTTKSTLSQWKSGIPMSALSATFRDAVVLTRRLGINYIWIDSLCIVQDDNDDWQREAAKMASVYSNSYLTLAATHSKDGRGGLFTMRSDYEVSGTSPLSEPYRLFFRQKVNHHLDTRVEDTTEGASPATTHHPLLTRAWVFQERLLSTRVVHFGSYEMFWECRSDIRCECGGIMYHGSSDSAPMMGMKLIHSEALGGVVIGEGWHVYAEYFIARLWRTMVCSYMELGITKPQDRLPAIGGLARHMAQGRKSRYFSGVWENTINDDLLWIIRTSRKQPRPMPQTAPSWSWASVHADVAYWDEIIVSDFEHELDREEQLPHEHFAKVNNCTVVPEGPDGYGCVRRGVLEVRGLLIEGILQREVQHRSGADIDVYYIAVAGSRMEMMADYSLHDAGHGHVPDGTQVFGLRMSQIQEGLTKFLVSLVLRRCADGSKVFERIGTMAQREALRDVVQSGYEDIYRDAQEQTVEIA